MVAHLRIDLQQTNSHPELGGEPSVVPSNRLIGPLKGKRVIVTGGAAHTKDVRESVIASAFARPFP
ncbi:MAG: hypothetical protein QOI18_666 [Solirubrobacteraceae bacterium]|jgi:hypothetical protein|nr:hypothetical protein [Solirubrobacteraceae bacterium]